MIINLNVRKTSLPAWNRQAQQDIHNWIMREKIIDDKSVKLSELSTFSRLSVLFGLYNIFIVCAKSSTKLGDDIMVMVIQKAII